jgi:hypothetical protein
MDDAIEARIGALPDAVADANGMTVVPEWETMAGKEGSGGEPPACGISFLSPGTSAGSTSEEPEDLGSPLD